jgi:hypothetical protein
MSASADNFIEYRLQGMCESAPESLTALKLTAAFCAFMGPSVPSRRSPTGR